MTGQASVARGKAGSLPGPENIYREVLPNGITILARSNFSSPSVTLSGYLSAGSVSDPDDKVGLANFAASALLRGTRRHSFDSLYDELESVGASLGIDAGVDSTGFRGHSLSEDLGLVLGLLSEVLRAPTFPASEVEKLRHQLLTGLAIRMQDTADMADIVFDEILYRDHPYGRPEDGNPKSIRSISRQDLVKFHRQKFGPAGLVIAIVGGVDPKAASRAVRRALGGWRNPEQPKLLPPEEPRRLRSTVKRRHRIAGKSQADIIIGTNGPRRSDPHYLAASMGNSVLGQFGMMGRIGRVVREESGLAYYAYSQLNAGIGPGSWTVSAGVNPVNVEKTCRIIIKELRRFVEKGVSQEELRDSKANFVGRLPLSLESNAGVAGALLNMERHQLGLDYYQRYAARVSAVRREEVLDVARRFIDPDRLVVATAGP